VSLGVDRANVGPVVSQLAGFGGAFLGALVAQRRVRSERQPVVKESEQLVGVGRTERPTDARVLQAEAPTPPTF
jgi:hypothetical protein